MGTLNFTDKEMQVLRRVATYDDLDLSIFARKLIQLSDSNNFASSSESSNELDKAAN